MRILIADDNAQVRRGVASFLSAADPNCEICGEAADGQQAVELAKQLSPDVVLLDVSMPGVSGLETARLLRQEAPTVKIIIMSQHDPAQLLPQALDVGAHACVDKCRVTTDLLATLRSLTAGPQRIET